MADKLRLFTSMELFLFPSFYACHPIFLSMLEKHHNLFQSHNSVLALSVSHAALDSGGQVEKLVQKEAVLNLKDKTWSSFLRLLALSSVTDQNIYCYYPDIGLEKFKVLMNQKISLKECAT